MNLKSKYKFVICIFFCCLTLNLYGAKVRGEYATKNLIGQEYYMNKCSECHGDGNRGGNMASIREWGILFSNDAKELINLHEEDDETIDIIKYLKSNKFKNESKTIVKFLQEFAYDSENIPTCN